MRNAMNEVLRDEYVEDCQRGVDHWNQRIRSTRHHVRADAARTDASTASRACRRDALHARRRRSSPRREWDARRGEWLPNDADEALRRRA